MADDSTHYVVTVQVHRVDIQTVHRVDIQTVHRVDIQTKVPGSGPRGAEFATMLDTPIRQVTKVAGFEVKSTDLEHLLARTEQHLKLVEDLGVDDAEALKPKGSVRD